ncbi:hypothetical protein C8R46DRAFT_1157802 [Mycena filopes]|nr:hypothetical protein C8R46DRAFT_1157802 [Mycena filopes]
MRFSTLFSALVVVATGVSAANFSDHDISTAVILDAGNDYGAPIPPWEPGHIPGWYFGSGPPPSGVFCVLDQVLCALLDLLPLGLHCPKLPPPDKPSPPPEFSQTFYNLTCAAQDDSYETFGLVDTIADCAAMCDAISGCTFFNTYHDVNGKDGSPQLTCALFQKCLTADSADNCGGQSQPDGSIDFIIQSDGFCKKKPTA